MTAPDRAPGVDELREALAAALAVEHGYHPAAATEGTGWCKLADALLPVVDAYARQRAAEELEAAFVEDRTTVAKLSPVERLTCFLVKSEDLVHRVAALRGGDRG